MSQRGENWKTKRREAFIVAHRNHAYQHAARRFGSHGKVTGAVTGINVFWLLPWALATVIYCI